VRRWQTISATFAARRLIWLVDLLAHEPDKLKTAMDLIVWGRGDELLKISQTFTPA
jgi:hypothetical protein